MVNKFAVFTSFLFPALGGLLFGYDIGLCLFFLIFASHVFYFLPCAVFMVTFGLVAQVLPDLWFIKSQDTILVLIGVKMSMILQHYKG